MNVFGPGNPGWDRRHPLIGETIRALDPDIVALQEVPVDTPEILERLIGLGYYLAPFSRPSDDGVAGTLATRWPHQVVAERVLDQPVAGVWASNHYGVIADLVAPPSDR